MLIPEPVKSNGVAPPLLSVTFNVFVVACLTVPKFRLVGLRFATGKITWALIVTGCGLPGALSVICKIAVCSV